MSIPKMNANLNVPLSSAFFTVDSRDGVRVDPVTGFVVDAQNPYDIQIYKNQQLFSGAIQRIALTEINMPYNVPNVNGYNNILFFEGMVPAGPSGPSVFTTYALGDNTTDVNNIIPVGFYTPEELATEIENLLNDRSVFGCTGWSCNYVNTTDFGITNRNAFEISNSCSIPFRINPKFKGNNTVFKNPTNGAIYNRSSTLAEMMGFGSISRNIGYDTIVTGNYASMLYTNYIDIVSPFLSKNMEVRDTSSSYFNGSDIVARIYIAREGNTENEFSYWNGTTLVTKSNILGTRQFHLNKSFTIPKQIRWNPNEFLPSCNIRLQDMYGNVLFSEPTFNEVGDELFGIYCGNNSWVEMNFLISEIN